MTYSFPAQLVVDDQPKATIVGQAQPELDQRGRLHVRFQFEGWHLTVPLKALHDIVKDQWPKAQIFEDNKLSSNKQKHK